MAPEQRRPGEAAPGDQGHRPQPGRRHPHDPGL